LKERESEKWVERNSILDIIYNALKKVYEDSGMYDHGFSVDGPTEMR